MFGKFNMIHTGRRDIIKPFKKLHGYDFHRLFASLQKLNLTLKLRNDIFH